MRLWILFACGLGSSAALAELTRPLGFQRVVSTRAACARHLGATSSNSILPRQVPACFTPRMLVLTPDGERPIGELRSGQQVYSVDVANGRVTTNTILRVHRFARRAFGVLRDLARPIEVTGDHRFWARERAESGYHAIGELPGDARLHRFGAERDQTVELEAVFRGCFELQPGENRGRRPRTSATAPQLCRQRHSRP